ncbi:RNA 2'-phosphotransferase [Desulfobacterales bacterium HSG16]|nr:RNA 2'-phosphotransferase [Desulfobacterales bacterium HSG16]
MKNKKNPERLARFLSYVLGRKPYEFGLIPDVTGYVKIKDLIKALTEEEGWGFVKKANINEALVSVKDTPVEIKDEIKSEIKNEIKNGLIRAKNREKLPELFAYAMDLPKLLYTCVRNRAHAFVLENGVNPGAYPYVILASNAEMAKRIGRRSDADPVLITVNTARSGDQGVAFFTAGEGLFTADHLPVGCFSAPPLPKKKLEEKKAEQKKKKEPETKPHDPMAGSFILDFDPENQQKKKALKQKKKDKIARDKEKRKARRQKGKMWE